MDEIWLSLRLLLLLGAANGAPIVAKRLLGSRWDRPIDGGVRFADGRPLLGPGKTIRGLVAATASTAAAAWVLDLGLVLGAVMGTASMAGDALSSFVKRRLGVAPSGQAPGLDQIPESLLPLLLVQDVLGLSMLQVLGISAAFFVLAAPLARLAYRLGLRDRPY